MAKARKAASSTSASVVNSKVLRLFILTIASVCVSLSSAFGASVQSVDVELTSLGGTMPPLVQKRIAASLETVGNHVFVGRDDGDIRRDLRDYDRTVNDIMNRVLIGYTVEDMHIEPGPETVIHVTVRPWGDTIQSVQVQMDYGALPPLGTKLARQDVAQARGMIENLLIGLPVDALDWANGAVQHVMENQLEQMLPEFYPHIVIDGKKDAVVTVYFLPKLPVIRNVTVDVEAENLPKVIFLSTRKNLEMTYSGLEGLPVAFVRRHGQDIQGDITQTLANQWVIKQYKLKVTPALDIGNDLQIHLHSETDFYDIQAGAYIDVSRDTAPHGDNTVLQAMVGRKIGDHHEVYGKVEFMPASVDWNIIPGYFYRWGRGQQLGYQFETDDDSHHLWYRQPFGRRWGLRLDRDLTHQDNEVGILYRIHEYVGLEYIFSDHDQWLRVIGYL